MRFEYEFGDVADENNDLVAKVEMHEHGTLLAAAPELLAALEEIEAAACDYMAFGSMRRDGIIAAIKTARAAIARAKGRG